jgi:hypothetical protein
MNHVAIVIGASILFSIVSRSEASIQVFTDLASLDATAGVTLVEDFLKFSPKNTNLGDSFTTKTGLTFDRVTDSDVASMFLLVVENNPHFAAMKSVSNVVTDNGSDDFILTFGKPTLAVGFDTYLNEFDESGASAAPEATVEVFGLGGTSLMTITHTHPAEEVGFLGLLADEPITAIRWTTTGGTYQNTGIGRIYQGGAAVVVPEPLSLFVWGILGCLVLSRRSWVGHGPSAS